MPQLVLPEDRYFDPARREVALRLYHQIADLPLVCPHGHVDPQLFADPEFRFGSPAELFITPDHYVFRMLRSQGITLEALGIPRADGGPVEGDPRKIWQLFADNYHLFRGTPTGGWLDYSFHFVFGLQEKLSSASAQDIYDHIAERLQQPDFQPRALYDRFNIEVLTTTDTATDPLLQHQAIRDSNWNGRILPTFPPGRAHQPRYAGLAQQHPGAGRAVWLRNPRPAQLYPGAGGAAQLLSPDGRHGH